MLIINYSIGMLKSQGTSNGFDSNKNAGVNLYRYLPEPSNVCSYIFSDAVGFGIVRSYRTFPNKNPFISYYFDGWGVLVELLSFEIIIKLL